MRRSDCPHMLADHFILTAPCRTGHIGAMLTLLGIPKTFKRVVGQLSDANSLHAACAGELLFCIPICYYLLASLLIAVPCVSLPRCLRYYLPAVLLAHLLLPVSRQRPTRSFLDCCFLGQSAMLPPLLPNYGLPACLPACTLVSYYLPVCLTVYVLPASLPACLCGTACLLVPACLPACLSACI
jgi:hypothetical protein